MISFHSINLLKLQIITTQFKIFIVVEAISLPRTATCRPYTMSIRKDLYIMKATGIVCRIDNLGRIVIPKENRRPGGFSKYVTQQISMMSNMRTYTENFGNIEKRNALYAQLSSKPESVHTHMVAIDCTWSQRAYSASIYSAPRVPAPEGGPCRYEAHPLAVRTIGRRVFGCSHPWKALQRSRLRWLSHPPLGTHTPPRKQSTQSLLSEQK